MLPGCTRQCPRVDFRVEKIQKRSKILRNLSKEKRYLFYKSLIGTKQNILFEQKKDGYWTGLTDNYVRVNVKSNKNLTNEFIEVKLKNILRDNKTAFPKIIGILNT